jgi:hypothetical protein
VAGMAAFILALHVIGWFTLVAIVAPGASQPGRQDLRHRHRHHGLHPRDAAFDADHIAAIDNTTRKLMGEGRRPLSVGFWFSLGHSSVVFGLAFLLSLGIEGLAGPAVKLRERLAQSEQTLDEFTDFRSQALARLAAQHEEIVRLRDAVAGASRVSRLPHREPPSSGHAVDAAGLLTRSF